MRGAPQAELWRHHWRCGKRLGEGPGPSRKQTAQNDQHMHTLSHQPQIWLRRHTHSDTLTPLPTKPHVKDTVPGHQHTALAHIHMTPVTETHRPAHTCSHIYPRTRKPETPPQAQTYKLCRPQTLIHSLGPSPAQAINWPMPQHMMTSWWFVCAQGEDIHPETTSRKGFPEVSA